MVAVLHLAPHGGHTVSALQWPCESGLHRTVAVQENLHRTVTVWQWLGVGLLVILRGDRVVEVLFLQIPRDECYFC